MFGTNRNKAANAWFPGQTEARDRWGNPLGADIKGREFQSGRAVDTAARLRWSLGHA